MLTSRKVSDSVEKRKLTMSNKFHTSRITRLISYFSWCKTWIFQKIKKCKKHSFIALQYRFSPFYICFVQLKLIIVNYRVTGSNGINESTDCPRSPRALHCEAFVNRRKTRDAKKRSQILFDLPKTGKLRVLIVWGYQLLIFKVFYVYVSIKFYFINQLKVQF